MTPRGVRQKRDQHEASNDRPTSARLLPSVRPYAYRDADTLIDDFWRDVEALLKKEGVE